MEAGPERRARVAPGTGAGAGTENRGAIMFLQAVMVIVIVGLIVAYGVIDV